MASSWGEYINSHQQTQTFCEKDIIFGQFKNIDEYKTFAEETAEGIIERRKEDKALDVLLLE